MTGLDFFTDLADAEQVRQDMHLFQGRIAGATGVASWCSCGRSFYGSTVAESSNSLNVHRADVLGLPVTSWLADDR